MVFQTVEIKILKKKSRFKRISHRSIIPKRTWTTLWSNKFPSCFLRSIYLESRNYTLEACNKRAQQFLPNSRVSNAFSLARVIPSGRRPDQKAGYEWVDSNRTKDTHQSSDAWPRRTFHSPARKRNACSLHRQYITPVITVKPASITIKRQMHG